ncbi:MAG: D-alanyl-D-alanine carboxypeptidase [Kiritimatiellae bacterium]|nr:D-alanyl-D-alanine carboxypeptidase [Kiritimatiellia bacterium]
MKKIVVLALSSVLFVSASAFAAQTKAKAPAKKPAAAQKATKPAPKKASAPAKKTSNRRSDCIAKYPYVGAIALDAADGRVLFEDKADAPGYPASTLKLMTLLVVQKKIESGAINLTDQCKVSVRAYRQGGSQCYLDPKETFPVEELLYALMVKSANDAAVCLAEHVAGSCEEFVAMMNKEAELLGMTNTRFSSVNGLPPNLEKGEKQDVTTARDMGKLCVELCRHPDIFKYTGCAVRGFREKGSKAYIEMRTHNTFLKEGMPGCDGFKTGYTATAGYSICVTVKRGDRRVIVVVLGSWTNNIYGSVMDGIKVRDTAAREIINKAFAAE